jgi:hypothetical protein
MNKKLLNGQGPPENNQSQPVNENNQTIENNPAVSRQPVETYAMATATKPSENYPTQDLAQKPVPAKPNRNENYSQRSTESTTETPYCEISNNSDDRNRSTNNVSSEHRRSNNVPRYKDSEDSGWKFVAAKRRKTNSYFIGNIDASVYDSDVRDYLTDHDISPTHLTMFYGKYGSSARITIHHEDAYKVESSTFWPEGVTCRKWVNKSSYERERDSKRKASYKDRSNTSHRDYGYDSRGYDDYRTTIGDYDRDIDKSKSFWSNNENDDW